MYTARKYPLRDHTPSTSTSTRSGRLLRLLTLSVLFLVLLVSVADATEYTVRPSRNVGQEPGTSMSGEKVQEIDPIPLWLFLLLCIFPQLTAAPIEALLPLKAVGYFGYRRVCRENALDNPRRLEILSFIKANPGLHFRELLRTMSVARGTLDYHVRVMVSGGLLKAVPEKGRIHYFPADSRYSAEEETLIIAMENDSLRRIILQIHLNQGARTEELAEESGLSRATIYTHVKHLEDLGIVRSERAGRSVRYALTDDYSRVLMIHQNSSPEPARVSV
ncbi:winged helix-turn-helix transcriptional regulator [Methanoculleus thermophilus]|uniref:Predicted transcriptional regulator, containsd two HTH domains n=1 Tax=Methanoculleus thermophilus TaxID=2200 RepID=A0A1G8X2G4_9EURY|nr:winged helix-turn-helix transcriptional regulator [Methanoculleus thermophilus]SDJ84839.1 Predicted transcriptional regulator, containsd two HTH domains [Methanoculleus thermophilus]